MSAAKSSVSGILWACVSVCLILSGYAMLGDGMHVLSLDQSADLRGGCTDVCYDDPSCSQTPYCDQYTAEQCTPPNYPGWRYRSSPNGYYCNGEAQQEESQCFLKNYAECAVENTCSWNAEQGKCTQWSAAGASEFAALSCEDAFDEFNW
jgi:hypothetical protein